MSILSDAQKTALFGRLLGLPSEPTGAASAVPERVAPTGTVAGVEPAVIAQQITSNPTLLVVGGLVAVLGVVFLAKKVL